MWCSEYWIYKWSEYRFGLLTFWASCQYQKICRSGLFLNFTFVNLKGPNKSFLNLTLQISVAHCYHTGFWFQPEPFRGPWFKSFIYGPFWAEFFMQITHGPDGSSGLQLMGFNNEYTNQICCIILKCSLSWIWTRGSRIELVQKAESRRPNK